MYKREPEGHMTRSSGSKARRREQSQLVWGNENKSGCNMGCGRGEGQMARGYYPHRTLERSTRQMVGS